jgi:hypothetical protein
MFQEQQQFQIKIDKYKIFQQQIKGIATEIGEACR